MRVRISRVPWLGDEDFVVFDEHSGEIAYGHFDAEGRFHWEWAYGLHDSFNPAEAKRAIEAALKAGPQYTTLFGDHYRTPR